MFKMTLTFASNSLWKTFGKASRRYARLLESGEARATAKFRSHCLPAASRSPFPFLDLDYFLTFCLACRFVDTILLALGQGIVFSSCSTCAGAFGLL